MVKVSVDVDDVLLYLSRKNNLRKDIEQAYISRDKHRIQYLQEVQRVVRDFRITKPKVRCYLARTADGMWVRCNTKLSATNTNKRWINRVKNN
jgi:hypothetical protein